MPRMRILIAVPILLLAAFRLGVYTGTLVPGPAHAQQPILRSEAFTPGPSRWIAYFTGHGNAYTGKRLYVRDRATGRSFSVGRADPYVRPVLSADDVRLLYARVRAVSAFPGARWSLLEYNRSARRSRLIVEANGMDLSPLGWRHGSPLYALARETQTGVYRISDSHSDYISFLFTQPLTEPSLSPGADFIAYVTPADCYWCTLSIFDMTTLTSWFGPTGVPNKYTIAWTPDGGTLVTIVRQNLAAIDVRSHHTRLYRLPNGLPKIWYHPMRAVFEGPTLRLVDTITGRAYTSSPADGLAGIGPHRVTYRMS